MKKENIISTVVMFLILTSTILCTVKLPKSPAATIDMTRIRLRIDYVDVDDLDSGSYTLTIGVEYKRMFETYGDQLLSDNAYEEYDFHWATYPATIQGNVETRYNNDLDFGYSYALDRSDTDDIIKVRFKLTKQTWPWTNAYIDMEFGDSEMYNTMYTTPNLDFNYFGGILNVRYQISTI